MAETGASKQLSMLNEEKMNENDQRNDVPEPLINKTPNKIYWESGNQTSIDLKTYKRKVWKNVLCISVVFTLVFAACGGLSRLQSSLHTQQGMGVTCLSVVYGSLLISCFVLPTPVIAVLGHKWTLVGSVVGYIVWMTANIKAVWYTMIPASVIMGLSASTLWTSKCSYLTLIGKHYADVTHQESTSIITLFFGIFFLFFQASAILGDIVSTTVLVKVQQHENCTKDYSNYIEMYCGTNDCPWNTFDNNCLAKKPSFGIIWTLCGVYIVIGIIGLIIAIFAIDNIPKDLLANRSKNIKKKIKHSCISTFKQSVNIKQLLLIPITIYSGLEQSFVVAEWTKSWVTCSIGIWMVGVTHIPYAVTDAIVSFTGGKIVHAIGRIPIFIFALVIDICIQVSLVLWKVNPDHISAYYIIPSLWGASDGVWQTQINALYAILFIDCSEEAFSLYRIWEAVGFTLAFGYSAVLCTSFKLYILFSVLIISIICCFIVEFLNSKCKELKNSHISKNDDGQNVFMMHENTLR